MSDLFENALYQSVESALDLMNCDIGPAECHGILCGMLCGGARFDPSAWLGHTTGYLDEIHFDDLGRGHALVELLDETVTGLAADDFSLRVLLPGDDIPLGDRIDALGAWSRGFLAGFGLTELSNLEQFSDDSQDFLRDLEQIGRIDPTQGEAEVEEEEEFNFLEVCEYVRMGALLLHEETSFVNDARDEPDTIH